jgi:hypothetical protein
MSLNQKNILFAGELIGSGSAQKADFLIPDYNNACITRIVPHIRHNLLNQSVNASSDNSVTTQASLNTASTNISPTIVTQNPIEESIVPSERYVLLVLDGLGYEQLMERKDIAPTLCSMTTRCISSVAPTTTSTALTSITTGLAPASHGVLGYRMKVLDGDILNVLRWSTKDRLGEHGLDPAKLQPNVPFEDCDATVVSRKEFDMTGFSRLHLRGVASYGWRVPSNLAVTTRNLLQEGKRFIYLYYDGMDKVAHEYGLGEYYDHELSFVDYLVGDIMNCLPKDTTLIITADHGQVEVIKPPVKLPESIMDKLTLLSGEGRFRWLHTLEGEAEEVKKIALESFGDVAVVATQDELVDWGIFGGELSADYRERLGDVAVIPREPLAFFDPNDTGELKLMARHGAMTSAEIFVPLLTYVSK